jgi:hypothetical protein
MIPKPFMIYGLLATIVIGFLSGWTVRSWRCDAAYSEALEKAAKDKEKMQTKIDNAATEYQQLLATMEPARIETRNNIREIYKNVEVPTSCSVPDAAVVLLESARSNTNAATTGRLGSGMQQASEAP